MTKLLLDEVEVNNLSLDEPKSTKEYENSNKIKKYKHYILNKIDMCNKKYVKIPNEVSVIYENLNEYLSKFSAYHLYVKSKMYENAYQVLLMQIFLFFKIRGLTAEENSGYGRYDFGFPNTNNCDKEVKEYILIEIKAFNKNTKPDEEINKEMEENQNQNNIKNRLLNECEDAINQIEEKEYEKKYRAKGYNSIVKYGIAFYKRTCEIKMKINDGEIQSSSKPINEGSNNRKRRKRKRKTTITTGTGTGTTTEAQQETKKKTKSTKSKTTKATGTKSTRGKTGKATRNTTRSTRTGKGKI
ncbi:hypothetical protein BCR36DRAFT_370622 [Piromyces finnis]|uniref:Uncharacterized protein n=1 Tax=Piromyces finnis TaxID=1754191 RepID=A0A1Y1V807_9FUNG|nr:hypothetical protein BCR36DRAFT_370622 [Piromyces finnis]|eukprot:ORX49597.1 hypothetical protein BCR36DRAFT_370622 [Piromyces finnis]